MVGFIIGFVLGLLLMKIVGRGDYTCPYYCNEEFTKIENSYTTVDDMDSPVVKKP